VLIHYDIEKIRAFVLGLTPVEVRDIGIKYRSTLKKLKDRVREGEFKLNTKMMRKILEATYQCFSNFHQ